jgi:hypothetical protein
MAGILHSVLENEADFLNQFPERSGQPLFDIPRAVEDRRLRRVRRALAFGGFTHSASVLADLGLAAVRARTLLYEMHERG